MRWRHLGLVLLAAGCQRGGGEGDIAVHWRPENDSTARVRLVAPAQSRWCMGTNVLEVMALGNDTGVGFVLYPGGKLAVGDYPIREPADTADRPRATVALRLLGLNLVHGYYGTSGTVRIRSTEPGISGEVQARMRELTGTRLRLEGEFRRLPVTTDSAGCPQAPAMGPGLAPAVVPGPADTTLR